MAEASRRLPRSTPAELHSANAERDGARKLIIAYARALYILFKEAASKAVDPGWAALDGELIAHYRPLWDAVVSDWNDKAVADRLEAQTAAHASALQSELNKRGAGTPWREAINELDEDSQLWAEHGGLALSRLCVFVGVDWIGARLAAEAGLPSSIVRRILLSSDDSATTSAAPRANEDSGGTTTTVAANAARQGAAETVRHFRAPRREAEFTETTAIKPDAPRPQSAKRQTHRAQVDGTALKKSIVPTWMMLVALSWVSLVWGAFISAPFGVGIGIAASMFASIFAVPLWGTVFGFLGMNNARDKTLRQIGFKELDGSHPLKRAVDRMAGELGLPPPQVGTMPAFNAFAIGSSPAKAAVSLGEPLLAALTPAEVEAVIGHELGHIVSGDMRRMMLMRTFQNALVWYGIVDNAKQVARWIICWASELAILAFSRKREFWADAIGAALTSKEAAISALRKLEQGPPLTADEKTHARFMVRGWSGQMFSTHPTTEQRIEALEQETYLRQLRRK